MIKAVIFDLDGTLVPFTLDVKACRTKVIAYLTEQGFPSSIFSIKETAFDMLLKVKKHMATAGTKKKFTDIEKTVHSIVESFELEAAKTTEMFSGVPETLKTLRNMNLKIALCTISGEKAAKHIIDRFGLDAFFDVMIMREAVPAVKPNPIHLETVLEALNVGAQEAVLVGDSVKDVICANSVNVLAVGVTTGLSSMDALTDAGANYIASSVTEIPGLIVQLNKQTDSEPVKKALLHVLHVDDDEDFLIISKRLLEKQGSIQVESVNSVKQALQKIGQNHYDAIVSDYKMFDKTGLELFVAIRNSGNDVPFFLVTGEEREEMLNKALNLGVDKCFCKDRNFEELFVELASAVKEAAKAKRSIGVHKR